MPVIGRTRIDGVHDVLSLSKELNSPIKSLLGNFLYHLKIQLPGIYQQLVLIGKISILLLLSWVVFLVIKKRQKIMSAGWSFLQKHPPFWFVLLAIGFGLVSQAIDLRFIRHPLLLLMGNFIEETLEMNIALSILFASFAIKSFRASNSLNDKISQSTETFGQIDVQHN